MRKPDGRSILLVRSRGAPLPEQSHEKQHIGRLVGHALPRADIQNAGLYEPVGSIEPIQPARSLAKTRRQFSSGIADDPVGTHARSDLARQRQSKEVLGQPQPQKKQAPGAQAADPVEHESPIERIAMRPNERSHVADPGEPAPAVLGWMAAQDQELVVERRLPHHSVHERGPGEAAPQLRFGQREAVSLLGKGPLQIEDHRTRLTRPDGRHRRVAGRTHFVPTRPKDPFCTGDVLGRNEQVEVGELPHGEASVQGHCQHGPLQGHSTDRMRVKQRQQLEKLSGPKQVEPGVGAEVLLKFVARRLRHGRRNGPGHADVQMRHHAVSSAGRHQTPPVHGHSNLLAPVFRALRAEDCADTGQQQSHLAIRVVSERAGCGRIRTISKERAAGQRHLPGHRFVPDVHVSACRRRCEAVYEPVSPLTAT